jgi:hypothetical protein
MNRPAHPEGFSLPEVMFLLAYDPSKQRSCAGGNLDILLRAAALTELWLDGRVTDENKKATPVAAPRSNAGTDLVAVVFADLADSGPRRWQGAVTRRSRQAVGLVRDGLAARGVITTEPRRILGIFPTVRVSVRDPLARNRLKTVVDRAIAGSEPVDRVEPWVVAAATMATTVPLNTVADRRKRRAHKDRIAALNKLSGPGVPALRRAIQGRAAAAAG